MHRLRIIAILTLNLVSLSLAYGQGDKEAIRKVLGKTLLDNGEYSKIDFDFATILLSFDRKGRVEQLNISSAPAYLDSLKFEEQAIERINELSLDSKIYRDVVIVGMVLFAKKEQEFTTDNLINKWTTKSSEIGALTISNKRVKYIIPIVVVHYPKIR